MKWALMVGGVVVALIAVVIIIGAMLPRDHVAAMSARIAAAPDAVWSAISEPTAFPSWRKDVKTVDLLAPTPTGPSWREHSSQGAITFVVDTAEPPRRLVTRITDKNLPFGGSWDYVVEPDGSSASRVTIIERGSVYNPLFRFVSRFIMGHTATIDAYLRALSKHFGDETTPTAVTPAGESHGL
jgi:uncharacterized protein YndB with AHSA1/START domain